MDSKIRFKIGEIEFEAEGSADIIAREREAFMQMLLPAAIDAIVKTRVERETETYIELGDKKDIPLISEQTISEETMVADDIMSSEENYSRINLAAYIKNKGRISEQDFTLFAAYFDEKKNKKKFFTKDDVDRYYSEARRTKPANISMSLNRLAEKGFIMDADMVEQKIPKPYIISVEGIKYIEEFQPKNDTEKNRTKSRKAQSKIESEYKSINLDDLNLSQYPEVKSFKDFKEKMMLVLYIITTEGMGEWFTTKDVVFLLSDIFGESVTKDQVNGVFGREKLWFKVEKVQGNKRDSKRKLLNAGIDYAKSLIAAKVNDVCSME